MVKQVKYVNVDRIHDDIWDARIKSDYNDKDETFVFLKQSIKRNGLFNPITITPTTTTTTTRNKKNDGESYYSVVDGRRRFEAIKQLGRKEIECFIVEGKTNGEIAAISLIQNLHRKNLNDIERCNGIAGIFAKIGYSIDEVITNCKRIHNQDLSQVDTTFIEMVETIGYSANFIYQLMQLLRDLPFKVLQYAEKKGLSTPQKILLTHSKLKEHPHIQKELVDDLAKTKDIKASRIAVYQVIRDLETGALFKSGKSYHVHTHLRDHVDKTSTEYIPYKNYIEIMKHSNELLKFLTGHQLAQREYEYNKNHINYSAQHRIDIVKTLDSRSIFGLMEQFRILVYAINSMESIVSGDEGEEVDHKLEK